MHQATPLPASLDGYRTNAGASYPAHYARPPVAPGSLSPHAMNAFGGAMATGPQSAQPLVVRSHPTVRTGLAILVAGTIIGGLLGISMRTRQSTAVASARQHERAEEVVAPNPTSPSAVPPASPTAVPFGALVVSPPPVERVASALPPVTQKVVQRHASTLSSKGPSAGSRPALAPKAIAKDKDKDGYRIASAGEEPRESKPAAKEPRPSAKDPKIVVNEPKEAKKPEVQPSSKGGDDSERVLKAAMGATENTL